MSVAIGLDISREKVDFYSEGRHLELKNEAAELKRYFSGLDRSCRIVMEATGKYHRVAHRTLTGLGFTVMVVNPYQTKHFAKAQNLLCKTDKVDAKMLCDFASIMPFKATECPRMESEQMQDLSRHLDDLKQQEQAVKERLRDESNGFIRQSLARLLEQLHKEIKETEASLKTIVIKDAELLKRYQLLLSIPGLGERSALNLLSYLRELGYLTKRQISALSGLAPMNQDSGQQQGRRWVKGGRHDVRRSLYMPVLGAATQHNERLKQFYEHLVSQGKPKKVALTACMRKLVVWANAVLMTGQPWNNNFAR